MKESNKGAKIGAPIPHRIPGLPQGQPTEQPKTLPAKVPSEERRRSYEAKLDGPTISGGKKTEVIKEDL